MQQEAQDFVASTAALKILGKPGQLLASKSLLILDSSFNPPHKAHLALIRKALEVYHDAPISIVLMFATNNADKGSKSAGEIAQRVALMEAFRKEVAKLGETHLCLTKHPFFKDKYEALREAVPNAKQVYIVGWDTALRILDPKYYEKGHLATALGPFFANGKLLCAVREDDSLGDALAQRKHMGTIAAGQVPGVPAAWSQSMALLELDSRDGLGVSSTKIRQALEDDDQEILEELLPPDVLQVLQASKTKQVDSLPWPTLTRQDVMRCSFSHWHPRFKSISPRARIIKPLPLPFLHYLNEDGLMLPQESGVDRFHDLTDSESDFEDEGFEEEDPTDAFKALHALIASEIAALGGAVVPKLNWSSPKDALWITADKTLKCTEPSDIYLLLKSSDFIVHDLEHAFDHCSDGASPLAPEEHELVLKKWFDAQPSMEFRCFVRNKQLVAISQRDINYYDFLEAQTVQIARLSTRLFQEHLLDNFESNQYAFDAYISVAQDKVWLLDISPCAPSTDSLLFSWQELFALPTNAATSPEIRLVSKDTVLSQGPQYSAHQVPFDLVDASDGVDVAEFARSFQTKLAKAALD